MVRAEELSKFTYDGEDNMIKFNEEDLPPVNKDFKVNLKLKDGTEIKASIYWRRKIWKWWYENRKTEIENSVIKDCANSLLGYGKYGTLIK